MPEDEEGSIADWMILGTASDESTGQTLKAALEQHDINSYLRPMVKDPFFEHGWGEILVPKEKLKEARRIVKEVLKAAQDVEVLGE